MDISTSEAGGGGVTVMQAISPTSTGRPVQLLQTGQVIQGANGQQIVIHAIPQSTTPSILGQTLQLASSPGGQIQVVPVNMQGGTGQIVVQQQPAQQTAQILQTADGQTFFYSPVQVDNTPAPVQQPTLININGNIMQLSAPTAQNSNANQSQPQQNIVMMTVPNPTTTSPTPTPGTPQFQTLQADTEEATSPGKTGSGRKDT
ncbi:hypothetical protein M8J77_007873 [Diaphorina citri]|nr:hypothetical protein M8J77_007873 [Diaphorina citri]